MNQKTSAVCPVCRASAEQVKGFRCPQCRLPLAFVDTFAGPKAIAYQQKQIQVFRAQRFKAMQRQYSDGLSFMLSGRCALHLDRRAHVLTVYSADGQIESIEDVLQYSRSRKHTLILHTDGTVEVRGSNDCGQCVVGDLRDVVGAKRLLLCGPERQCNGTGRRQIPGRCGKMEQYPQAGCRRPPPGGA